MSCDSGDAPIVERLVDQLGLEPATSKDVVVLAVQPQTAGLAGAV